MKKYFDCFVPIYKCNFKCHYCYLTLQNGAEECKEKTFPHSVEEMARALSAKRIGKDAYINLCASGETLLQEETVRLVRALLEDGHHVSIVTNGSITKRLSEIAMFPPDLLERLFFKFSYHYLELRRLNLFEQFFSNVRMMRDVGCSFTLEIVPCDELIPFIEDAKNRCIEALGAVPHCTIARDDRKFGIDILSGMSFDEYQKVWSAFDSELFRYKAKLYQHPVQTFCYAGDWCYYVHLGSGEVRPCNCGPVIANIYQSVDQPLPKRPMGNYCELPYCYNGHSWLSLGVNPGERGPKYSNLRNRICMDGTEWVKASYQRFWNAAAYDTNEEYSEKEKRRINRKRWRETHTIKLLMRALRKKIKRAVSGGDKA